MKTKKRLHAVATLALITALPAAAQLQLPEDTTLVHRMADEVVKQGIVENTLNVINGRVAGVSVTTNGLERMAMLNSVRVRGTTSIVGGNDPLVIIDGATSEIEALSNLYPADIESFAVLKNASETSVYGSRGASGVIEVKTKKGTGGGFRISYDGNYGVEAMYKHLNMLPASDYLKAAADRGQYTNNGGADVNYFDAITRPAFVQNHHFAFSGGTPQSNYRASFGYVNHNTIIKDRYRNSLVAKVDVTQKAFNDRLTAEFGVFGSSSNDHDIFAYQTLFYAAACQNPTFPYSYTGKNEAASAFDAPVLLLDEKNDTKDLSLNTHLRLTYDLSKSLKVSAFGSYLFVSTENARFCPTAVWAQGNIYRGETKREEWFGNVTAEYNLSRGIHALTVTAGAEYQRQRVNAFWTQAKGITSSEYGYYNLGVAASRPYGGTGSLYEAQSIASVMATANYTVNDRYTATATLRGDGSSMVGDDHTWGLFPSLSLTWDAKKENFLAGVRPLSTLKLRTGIGRSGNLGGISPYTTLSTVGATGLININGSSVVTLGTLRNTNPDLTWETKTTFNVGAEVGLFNNRVMLTAEYYYSRTSDMLYEYDVPVPPFTYDKLLANIGSMSNSGFEVGLSVAPIVKKDMELNVNVNLAFQQNKLISLSGDYRGMQMTAANVTAIGAISGAGQNGGDNNVVYQIVGQSLGVFYLPHCRGLVTDDNGNVRYDIEDLDGDGVVDLSSGGDRYIAGQATPKVTLGSNISFRYKQFYASLQMNGAFGHKIFNGTALAYNNMSSFPTYNVLQGAPERGIVDQRVSDYWLESGNYLNFECLTIGYNVPLKSSVVRSLRLSASVNNLATITAYSGLTPMINSYVVNSTLGIDDKRSYPVSRTYSVGVSVQF